LPCGIFQSLTLAKDSRLLNYNSKRTWVEISTNQWDCYLLIVGTCPRTLKINMCAHPNDSLKNCSHFFHHPKLQAPLKTQK